MVTKKKDLLDEFLSDHQRMTQLLRDLVSQLERADMTAAQSIGHQLDRLAGPHIAFEELVLYPAVRKVVGDSFERKLLAEHANAQSGLAHLLSAEKSQLANQEFREKVAASLHSGLKHAESCGTLVSHLEQLSETQQQQALTSLEKLRQTGKRWTEL